ncbi:MAG: molecular chaperone TorD family protein [Thermoproteota archaeon]
MDLYKAFIFSYLARAFAYPTKILIDILLDGLEDLEICLNKLNIDFGIKSFKQIITKLDLASLQADYTKLFLLALLAPMSETSYEIDKTSRRAYELADVSGFYKAFGVEPNTGVEPDNLQIELEFLSILLQKKILLEDENNKDGVEICEKAYYEFLQDHLGRWYDLFVKLINEHSDEEFYKVLANLLKAFIDIETKDMKIYKLFTYKEETLKGNSWACST